MILVYSLDIKNNIQVLDFCENLEESNKIMENRCREFIEENEGKKKWDYAFIENLENYSKLKNGYYFLKKETSIEIYYKSSENKILSGWMTSTMEENHQINLHSSFKILEFPKHLLNKFIVENTSNKILLNETKINKKDLCDIMKPNIQIRSTLNSIVEELRKSGFKPIKK